MPQTDIEEYRAYQREYQRKYQAKTGWGKKHRQEVLQEDEGWKEKEAERKRRWYQANKERLLAKQREYEAKKRAEAKA